MFLRKIVPADHARVAGFLDARTMALRWLVAFFKHLSLLPEEQSEYWSLWCDGDRDRPEVSCVAAHFFPMATTSLCAAEDADLGALEILCEEELLPERIVGDREFMERLE